MVHQEHLDKKEGEEREQEVRLDDVTTEVEQEHTDRKLHTLVTAQREAER